MNLNRSFATNGELVDRIYEAAIVPDLWPEVLRRFAHAAESRIAALIAANGSSFKWIGCSAEAEEVARQHYNFAGGAERSRRLLGLQRLGFATDLEVFTEEEMIGEPLFRDYLFPNGYGRGIATAINMPTGDTFIINAEGDFRLGPVGAELFSRLNDLRGHLARSILISARLAFERARTAVETLAGLGLSACAVTQSGAVVVANAQFDGDATMWTTRGGDRIALIDRRADRQLRDTLATLEMDNGVRSLALAGTEARPPAVLHVVPIRRSAHDLFVNAAAILVLTVASAEPTGATPLLQALFDLTPAEAVIAARIAAGQTAEQIALSDNKSVDTVRNQLKSVLAKTGCRRQVDLTRLLAQLVPAGM